MTTGRILCAGSVASGTVPSDVHRAVRLHLHAQGASAADRGRSLLERAEPRLAYKPPGRCRGAPNSPPVGAQPLRKFSPLLRLLLGACPSGSPSTGSAPLLFLWQIPLAARRLPFWHAVHWVSSPAVPLANTPSFSVARPSACGLSRRASGLCAGLASRRLVFLALPPRYGTSSYRLQVARSLS